ncbi:hypothetical protein MYX07_05260 [Patescibacteria group bacterium AH-259-L07]|nr:hypothetical protein [Patescibacteria group bacterium AH-259-L07]
MNSGISDSVLRELKSRGITLAMSTLTKHKHQGLMSTVFTVQSNKGELIVHISKLVEEHRRNKVWEKFSGLAKLIKLHPEIPTAPILCAYHDDGIFVLVQKMLDGDPAGERILKKGVFIDEWHADKILVRQVLKALAAVHAIQLEKFGWPVVSPHGALKGLYRTFKEFFEKESPLWIETIVESNKKFSKNLSLSHSLKTFIQRTILDITYNGPSVLVHGDAINPSNVLVNKGRISLLDWEWSIAADPAWEFCDLGWWPFLDRESLIPYFEASHMANESEKEKFLQRIQLYIPLWLLWGTYMHAKDSDLKIYNALRDLLILKCQPYLEL